MTDTLASEVPGALPAEISTSTEGRQKPLQNYPNKEKIVYKSSCTFSWQNHSINQEKKARTLNVGSRAKATVKTLAERADTVLLREKSKGLPISFQHWTWASRQEMRQENQTKVMHNGRKIHSWHIHKNLQVIPQNTVRTDVFSKHSFNVLQLLHSLNL